MNMKALPQNSSGGIKENHEESQIGQPVIRPTFELGTSRTEAYSFTATPICSADHRRWSEIRHWQVVASQQTELETVGAVNQLLDMYMCCAPWVSWLEVIYWENATAPCFFIIIYECNPYGQPWLNYTSTNIIHHTPYKTELKSFKSGRDFSVEHGGMQDTGRTFFFSHNIQSETLEHCVAHGCRH
jgi:hypothetical protein